MSEFALTYMVICEFEEFMERKNTKENTLELILINMVICEFKEFMEQKNAKENTLQSTEKLGFEQLEQVVLAIRKGKIPDFGIELGAIQKSDFSQEAMRRLDLYLGKRKKEWTDFQYVFESIALKAEKLTPELAYEIWGDFLK